jgi:hypothetical protein
MELQAKLIYYSPEALNVIETAGCVCYDSEPGRPVERVKRYIKSGHLSVTEHSRYIFELFDVPDKYFVTMYQITAGFAVTYRENSAILSLNLRSVIDLIKNEHPLKDVIVPEINKIHPELELTW